MPPMEGGVELRRAVVEVLEKKRERLPAMGPVAMAGDPVPREAFNRCLHPGCPAFTCLERTVCSRCVVNNFDAHENGDCYARVLKGEFSRTQIPLPLPVDDQWKPLDA